MAKISFCAGKFEGKKTNDSEGRKKGREQSHLYLGLGNQSGGMEGEREGGGKRIYGMGDKNTTYIVFSILYQKGIIIISLY